MGHLYEPARCSLCNHSTKFSCDCRSCNSQPEYVPLCTPCWLEHVDSGTPIPALREARQSRTTWKRPFRERRPR